MVVGRGGKRIKTRTGRMLLNYDNYYTGGRTGFRYSPLPRSFRRSPVPRRFGRDFVQPLVAIRNRDDNDDEPYYYVRV